MKILVTGGAGFIGSHVADAFIEDGHQVLIVDDLSTGRQQNLNLKAEFLQEDIRSDTFHQIILDYKPDVIDHHAAHIHVGRSVEHPRFDADVNIFGTLNLLDAAKQAGSVKHIIFAATGGAMYGPKKTPFVETMTPQPLSPYGISKRACELYLYFYQEQFGIQFTSLRYANVYGPRQNPEGEAGVISIFIETLKQQKTPIINGDGTQTRDYVFVGDVARANVLALKHPVSGEFNIGTSLETDVNTIYAMIASAVGSSTKATHGPARSGEQVTSSLNYSKAKQTFGWQPLMSLSDGIKETVASFLSSK